MKHQTNITNIDKPKSVFWHIQKEISVHIATLHAIKARITYLKQICLLFHHIANHSIIFVKKFCILFNNSKYIKNTNKYLEIILLFFLKTWKFTLNTLIILNHYSHFIYTCVKNTKLICKYNWVLFSFIFPLISNKKTSPSDKLCSKSRELAQRNRLHDSNESFCCFW